MNNILLIITSFIVMMIGIVFTSINCKDLPVSISSIVYDFSRCNKLLWTFWMWTIGSLILMPLLDSLETSNFQFIGFLTVISLLFCGAIPVIESERNVLHNIFGTCAGIFSQLCVLIINPLSLFIWGICVGILSLLYLIKIIFKLQSLYKLQDYIIDKITFISEFVSMFIFYCCLIDYFLHI